MATLIAADATAYLGLGGNLGDVAAAIGEALRRLDATPAIRVVRCSALYRTPPWGETDQPPFLNAAAAIATRLAPHALLDRCLAVEAILGRVRTRRWGPRNLDIDILAYDDLTIADSRLTLPHPRLVERAFALVPLAEIAPDLVVAGHRVADLLARVDRTGILPAGDAATETPT